MGRTAFGTLIVALFGLSSPARAADAPVTFTKDVAPILYKSCIECHRPTMFAPMSLVTFDDARPWARSIKQRVVSRAMPPWGADPAHGSFKNDPRLSQTEIDTIAKWVDDGAPKGDDKDLPPVPQLAEGWTIGKPDAKITVWLMFRQHAWESGSSWAGDGAVQALLRDSRLAARREFDRSVLHAA